MMKAQYTKADDSLRQGFTLVELLVVVTIMSLLIALVGLTVPAGMASQQLGGMGRQLSSDLDHARQLAQKDSQPIEVRFYRFEDKESLGGEEFRAYQVLKITGWDDTGRPEYTPVSEPQKFASGVILMAKEEYSSLLSQSVKTPQANDPDIGKTYQYISYQIRPDGGTNLPRDEKTIFTLVLETPDGSPDVLPADYRSIVMDPITGEVRLY